MTCGVTLWSLATLLTPRDASHSTLILLVVRGFHEKRCAFSGVNRVHGTDKVLSSGHVFFIQRKSSKKVVPL